MSGGARARPHCLGTMDRRSACKQIMNRPVRLSSCARSSMWSGWGQSGLCMSAATPTGVQTPCWTTIICLRLELAPFHTSVVGFDALALPMGRNRPCTHTAAQCHGQRSQQLCTWQGTPQQASAIPWAERRPLPVKARRRVLHGSKAVPKTTVGGHPSLETTPELSHLLAPPPPRQDWRGRPTAGDPRNAHLGKL